MPFKRKNSLRYQTQKRIKSEHVELTPPKLSFIKTYFGFISQRDKWWLVFLHVICILFLLSFLRLNIISLVKFDEKTAATLIDQRASNVATIISMTLAVIGLLLSNLAIKDNQTYKLLFVNSRLYLILYYTLSVIFCLILISTLRDTLDKDLFEQFVLAGTYLALLILFGIGYLFRTIINFANASNIQQILTIELLSEARYNLRIHLLSKLSLEEFLQIMIKNNISKRTLNVALHMANTENSIPNRLDKKERLIYDIDLNKLEKELAKEQTRIQRYYSTPMSLNLVTNDYDGFITPNPVTPDAKSMDLSSCIIHKKKSRLITQSEEYRTYFDKNLLEYSNEGKHSKVNEILSVYQILFALQMKHG